MSNALLVTVCKGRDDLAEELPSFVFFATFSSNNIVEQLASYEIYERGHERREMRAQ